MGVRRIYFGRAGLATGGQPDVGNTNVLVCGHCIVQTVVVLAISRNIPLEALKQSVVLRSRFFAAHVKKCHVEIRSCGMQKRREPGTSANRRLDKCTGSKGGFRYVNRYMASLNKLSQLHDRSQQIPLHRHHKELKRGSKQINNQVSQNGRDLRFLARARKIA